MPFTIVDRSRWRAACRHHDERTKSLWIWHLKHADFVNFNSSALLVPLENTAFSLARQQLLALSLAPLAMIYPQWITLKLTMLTIGALLLLGHALVLLKPDACKRWLRDFPRNKPAGVLLAGLAALWFYFLIKFMDLGEFSSWRAPVLIITPVAALLAIFYMREFLAVRALGTTVLLLAEPLLESAFLRDEKIRIALVLLVYLWVVLAMFWVGMPYVLRDQINWVTATSSRFRTAALLGFAYGGLLCVGGLFCG